MIDIGPPPLILPSHFEGKRPAIIRPEATPQKYFPAILPGIAPIIVSSGPPPVTSIAFQTSAWVRAASITCPTIQAGDFAVLFDWAVNFTGIPTLAIPSGFTQIATATSTAHRGTVSYKVLSGTESGSSLSGQSGASGQNKAILIFRPNGAISTVTTSTWLGEVTTGNPASQNIAASGQPTPLIRLATAAQNVTGSVSFAAGTFDGTVAAGNDGTSFNQIVGYAVQNSSPSDNSVDMNDFGTNWLASGWVRFA